MRRSRNIAGARGRLRRSAWSALRTRRALSFDRERVDGKMLVAIRPHRVWRPAGGARKILEALDGELVAVLGVDRLARAERDGAAGDHHRLALAAGEMHLDARALAIVE